MDSELLNLVIFIRRSKLRRGILTELSRRESGLTATDIASTLGTAMKRVSERMRELEREGFVMCLTPEEPHFRYYAITEKGRTVFVNL